MEFSRQENWNELPFSSLGDLPNPGIKPESPACKQIIYSLSHKGSPQIYIFENQYLEQEWSYTFKRELIKQICLGISLMF